MKKTKWVTPWGEIKLATLLLHVSRKNTSGQQAVFYQSWMLVAFGIMHKAITTTIIDFIYLIKVVWFGPHSDQQTKNASLHSLILIP